MKRFYNLSQISILFASIFLSSCLGTKFLGEKEKLLASQKIVGVSGSLKDNAKGLLEQEPNTRMLFGYPFTHLAHLYQLGENGFIFSGYDKQKAIAKRDSLEKKYDRKIANATKAKKKQKLRAKKTRKYDKRNRKVKQGNQLMRWGEPLAKFNPASAGLSGQLIKQYLGSKGYFNATIRMDTSTYDSLGSLGKAKRSVRNWVTDWAGDKDKLVDVEYTVDLNTRYYIDSIAYEVADTVLYALIKENRQKFPFEKGYYDQEVLTTERDFVYNLAINNGYYEFSKQYISFQVDTTELGRDTVMVKEVIINPKGKKEHKIFYLDSIVFVADANINETTERSFEQRRDITFSFGKNRYSKKILAWRIPLEQDDRYSRDLTIETQRQLSFLDIYKFININYDTSGNYFVANIFTSPFDKFQTSSEFGLSSTQGRPGPFVNINLKNRNTFRAMEILSVDANAQLEDIPQVREESGFDGNYTSRQFGAEAAITFPQFLFPLGKYYKNEIGQYNPKTRIALGFSFEDRVNEYRRLTYRGSWSYSWQIRDQVRYTLTPVQISLINSENTTTFQNYLDSLSNVGNQFALGFESAVVNSTEFQLDYSVGSYGGGESSGLIRFAAEVGGQFNRPFGLSVFSDDLETFEYAKTNVDLRRIERLTRKLLLAMRFNIGFAYPYGDNQILPYQENFFAGGSSSIRAWRPRRLGPGAYGEFIEDETTGELTDEVNYAREQPGDLLIEAMIEFRQDLVGFVEGALFFDIGNVWIVNSNSVSVDPEGDDGIFRFDSFLNELAVGTGVGLRFDLQFLVFRLDLGIKLFDPAQKRGDRYVGDELFSNFSRNTELNIGIGYPF